jgi:cytochrome P450
MHEPTDPIAAAIHPDPYPYYARLTSHRPPGWDASIGMWVAASSAAVAAVLTSPACRVRPPGEPVPAALVGTPVGEVFARLTRMSDGARHARLKPAVAGVCSGFHPAAVREVARRAARELWTELGGWGGGDFAFRLPVHVVATLLGMPSERLREIAGWTGDFVRAMAPGAAAEEVARGSEAIRFLTDCLSSSPTLSALDPEDAAANLLGLLFQSHDAGAGLIGNAIVVLAEHPDVLARVRSQRSLIAELVDEVLRFDPPVQNTRRWLAEDAEVGGVSMRSGDAVLVLLAAAGRDPAANPEPDRFRIDRSARRSYGFGAGVHACPGAAIATVVAGTAVEQLLDQNTDFEQMAGGRSYRRSVNSRVPVFGSAGYLIQAETIA